MPGPRRQWRGDRPRNTEGRKFGYMLDIHRVVYFKYDLNEILEIAKLDPRVKDPLMATIIAKASRSSINDALDLIEAKQKEGVIDEKTGERIVALLRRYTRSR